MKILITGGAGFIGSNFVRYWHGHYPDDQIVVLDALTYAGNLKNLKGVQDSVTFIHGDISDLAAVDTAMAGADTVVHFAAETHVDRSIKDPDVFIKTNIYGTHVLLQAAQRHGVERFHHISTDEVFGSIDLDSDEVWTEQTRMDPRSPYSASKASAEMLVRAYATTFGLPVTISNCTNNYGPNLYPEKLLALAITNIIEGKKIPVYGQGNQIREWLYVEDHCSAIDAILKKGKVGETYLVGPGDKHVTNLELIQKVVALMHAPEGTIEFVQDRPGHDQKYALSTEKITRELGWKPSFSLDQGLEKTIAWYQENQDWWKEIKSGEYRKYYEDQYGKK